MMRRCTCLFVAGTVLQWLFGNIQPSFLAHPWGLVLALNYLYLLILLNVHAPKWKWVQTAYDRPAYIASLASLLILTFVFGLTRQDGSTDSWTGALGFTHMSTSWIFNLFLFQFMTAVGLKAIEDIRHWRQRKLPIVIMHTAFFLLLVSALFGSGDKLRVKTVLHLNIPERTGITPSHTSADLPFTLTLKAFVLDEYPPHIHLYNKGILSPEFVAMDSLTTTGQLGGWHVECIDYIDKAGSLPEDSGYVPLNHVGATTAVRLKATHTSTRTSATGWVSCGSYLFPGSTLPLPDGSELVMPRREVKKFLSKVEATGQDGEKKTFDISVNHPARLGAWQIYQSGYDSTRGRWSTVSILECVRDGWYTAIHICLWMILIAATSLLAGGWHHRKKKEEKL